MEEIKLYFGAIKLYNELNTYSETKTNSRIIYTQ